MGAKETNSWMIELLEISTKSLIKLYFQKNARKLKEAQNNTVIDTSIKWNGHD